jgi:hypothetical protein
VVLHVVAEVPVAGEHGVKDPVDLFMTRRIERLELAILQHAE